MNLIYVRADGSIAKKVTNANVVESIDGLTAVEITEPCSLKSSYYLNGAIMQKSYMALSLSDGLVGESITVSGIPTASSVTWPDGVTTTESGSLTFDANVQGAYTFKIYHPAHYLERITVNVA